MSSRGHTQFYSRRAGFSSLNLECLLLLFSFTVDYLSVCQQVFVRNEECTEAEWCVSGIPQGSVLWVFVMLTVYLKQLRAYFFFVDNLWLEVSNIVNIEWPNNWLLIQYQDTCKQAWTHRSVSCGPRSQCSILRLYKQQICMRTGILCHGYFICRPLCTATLRKIWELWLTMQNLKFHQHAEAVQDKSLATVLNTLIFNFKQGSCSSCFTVLAETMLLYITY